MINPFKYLKYLKQVADEIDEQNEKTREIIKTTKAMLNGEDEWFLVTPDSEEIRLECECKKVDNHAD